MRCRNLRPVTEIEGKDKKDYKTSLNEIKTLLSLEFDNNNSEGQLILDELYYDVLKRIGLISDVNNQNEVEELKKIINKEMDFDYHTFINLIAQLSNKYCTDECSNCEENPIKITVSIIGWKR